MTNTEVIEAIKAHLAALPPDVCEEVESVSYNACGWPEAPYEVREATGYRWWPQVVLALFDRAKVVDPLEVALGTPKASRTEEQEALVGHHEARRMRQQRDGQFETRELGAMTSWAPALAPMLSCGNPRCCNPAHVINSTQEPARAAKAIAEQVQVMEWASDDTSALCFRDPPDDYVSVPGIADPLVLRKARESGITVKEQRARWNEIRNKEIAENGHYVPRPRPRSYYDLRELAREYVESPTSETKERLFNTTFVMLRRKVFEVANRVLPEDAEAAVQEAFLSLWADLDSGNLSFVPVAYPAWVSVRLANDARNYAQSQRRSDRPGGRRILHEEDLGAPASVQEGVLDDWNPPLEEVAMQAGMCFPSAEDDAIAQELAEAVDALLVEQTSEVRELYESCVLGDTPLTVFAEQSGVSRRTAFYWQQKLKSDIHFVVTGERVAVSEDGEEVKEPRKAYDAPEKELSERIRRKHRELGMRSARIVEAKEFAERGECWTIERSRVREMTEVNG